MVPTGQQRGLVPCPDPAARGLAPVGQGPGVGVPLWSQHVELLTLSLPTQHEGRPLSFLSLPTGRANVWG